LISTVWDPGWGSRSNGTKNNDPLEPFVFVGLLEKLSQLGWGIRDKPQRWKENPVPGRNTTVNVGKMALKEHLAEHLR
jgi:hypothetical protein